MKELYRDIFRVKAVMCEDDETVLNGFLYMRFGTVPHVSVFDPDDRDKDEWWEVERSTICRCTGIMLPETQGYLYEYDLVEFVEPFREETMRMGYIDFDDYSSSWVIRVSANTSLKRHLKTCLRVRVIGNVILYKDDMPKFQTYTDSRENDQY